MNAVVNEEPASAIPADVALEHEKKRKVSLLVESRGRLVCVIVSCIAILVWAIVTRIFLDLSFRDACKFGLPWVVAVLVATIIVINIWRHKVLSLVDADSEGLIDLDRQIATLNCGMKLYITWSTPLELTLAAARECLKSLIANISELVTYGDLEDDAQVMVFEMRMTTLLNLAKSAPWFVTLPNIPNSWNRWITKSGLGEWVSESVTKRHVQ